MLDYILIDDNNANDVGIEWYLCHTSKHGIDYGEKNHNLLTVTFTFKDK